MYHNKLVLYIIAKASAHPENIIHLHKNCFKKNGIKWFCNEKNVTYKIVRCFNKLENNNHGTKHGKLITGKTKRSVKKIAEWIR